VVNTAGSVLEGGGANSLALLTLASDSQCWMSPPREERVSRLSALFSGTAIALITGPTWA
jgi:hypothetical protein